MPDGQGDTTVTEPRASDARLVDAFQALDEPDEALPEEVRDRIWRAVSGALPAEERRDVIELTATSPAYAHAWRVAHEMWQASRAADAGVMPVDAPPRRIQWTPRWLAAAAAVVLGTTLAVTTLLNRPPANEYRESGGYRVESLIQASVVRPRDAAVRLRWTPGPAGSRYRVRLTTESLQVLATAGDLDGTEWVVDPSALANVATGSTVLWQVEATLPSGDHVTSETFTIQVR